MNFKSNIKGQYLMNGSCESLNSIKEDTLSEHIFINEGQINNKQVNNYRHHIKDLNNNLQNQNLTDQQRQRIMLKIMKYKCLSGDFILKNNSKHCSLFKNQLVKEMGEYATNFCFVVYTGYDNDTNISVISDVKNDQNYEKIYFHNFTCIVYETHREPQVNQQLNKCASIQSINCDLDDPKSQEEILPSFMKPKIQQRRHKQIIQNKSKSLAFLTTDFSPKNSVNQSYHFQPNFQKNNTNNKYINYDNRKSIQYTNEDALNNSLVNMSQISFNYFKNQNHDQDIPDIKPSQYYLYRQIKQDEKRIEKSKLKFLQNESTLIFPEVPSKDSLNLILKRFKYYLRKKHIDFPYNTKDYSQAIYNAFKKRGIIPKCIIVKREPFSDYFIDYQCEYDALISNQDLIKDHIIYVMI